MRSRIKPAHVLVTVLVVALLLRALLLAAWYRVGRGAEIAGDAVHYVEFARDLAAGRGLGDQTRRPPLCSALLAVMPRLPPFPQSVQSLLGGAGGGQLRSALPAGLELMRRLKGLQANSMLAFHCYSARQAAAALPELDLRLELLVFVFLALSNGLLFAAGVLLLVAPWVARNSLIHGKLVPIIASAGRSIRVDNNSTSTGGRTGGDCELHLGVRYRPHPERPPMWAAEADRYLASAGLRFIRDNPGRFGELCWRRVLNMWRAWQLDSPRQAKLATALSYLPALALGLAWQRLRPPGKGEPQP